VVSVIKFQGKGWKRAIPHNKDCFLIRFQFLTKWGFIHLPSKMEGNHAQRSIGEFYSEVFFCSIVFIKTLTWCFNLVCCVGCIASMFTRIIRYE